MYWRAERGIVLLAVLALSAGCYRSTPCGEEESCNYEDDDCDGRIDEAFRDDAGVYVEPEHCGGCGVDCASELPTAEETECAVDPELLRAGCRIVSCPEGFHLAGDTACIADVPVLCAPCTDDADCALATPGSACLDLGAAEGLRCFPPCGDGCPDGFVCQPLDPERSVCFPTTTSCACSPASEGVSYACTLESPTGDRCAGERLCGPVGFSDCEAALPEACDELDDDCDGAVDEDFRDDTGLYVDALHCGACASPCVAPGPNMVATCAPDAASPLGVRCDVACEEGFVDVDRIPATGCECELFSGSGPPPVIGGDADCDGVPEDDANYVFVTTDGSDLNPGTLVLPMRSIQAAMLRGQAEGKGVLVARGIYDGTFDLIGGVSVYGGYRPDFADRDLTLYPVVVERRGAPGGFPVVTCANVRTATTVEGFTVQATDAVGAGEGSTAIYLDGCGPEVRFSFVTVLSGRGAAGVRGDSSSDNLDEVGLGSLAELEGVAGAPGGHAPFAGCPVVAAGAGGAKACPGGDVSGGDGGNAACPPTGCVNGSPCGNGGCTDYTVGGVCDFDAVLADAVPNPPAESGAGPMSGSAGELTYDAPTNRGVCNFCDDNPTLPRDGGRGGDGGRGDDGAAGLGCSAGPVVDRVTGRVSALGGTDGAPGTNGSGGGGGTAGAGYAVIGGTVGGCSSRSGGAGGGGGSGGCGAPRAEGGSGGGASIGVLVVLPAGVAEGPSFEDGRVITASGGAGGDGGIGAAGGSGGGGAGGGDNTFWCARIGGRGGDGGDGGAAGGAGGGCGGGSHAFYVEPSGAGVSPAYQTALGAVAVDRTGTPGRGGDGGFSPGNGGTAGQTGSGSNLFLP